MQFYEGAEDGLWPETPALREWIASQPLTDLYLDVPPKEGYLDVSAHIYAVGEIEPHHMEYAKRAADRRGVTEEEWRNRLVHVGTRIPDGMTEPRTELAVYVKTRTPE